jgi:tetratricopeptide (TPR) repeat protein
MFRKITSEKLAGLKPDKDFSFIPTEKIQMNIWQWFDDIEMELIEQGHHRLAQLLNDLPNNTVNENHSQVDAILPEALALARAVKHPWLEVFIRHWNLQSRVVHRYEVAEMLSEAVSLLEFSTRDETRDCPQSICVVQDLTICYSLADGPGYADDCLAVCKETLEKIDESWPCFSCISSEYADALLQKKQYQEAFNFLQQQNQTFLLTHQYDGRFELRSIWVETLIHLQRYQEAYDFNKEAYSWDESESELLTKAIDEARITAHLGRYDEAKNVLPAFEQISNTSEYFSEWADAVELLINAEVIPNDSSVNAQFQLMSEKLAQQGVIRQAFTITLSQAELALKRGDTDIATHCCERADALIPKLHKPVDAPELLKVMRADISP